MRFIAVVMYRLRSLDVAKVAKGGSKSSAPAVMREGSHGRGVTAAVIVLLSSALMMVGCSGKGASVATDNTLPTSTPLFATTNLPGTYTSVQQVTIIDTTPGAVIYYTTDGVTQPTAIASEQYSGPITVSSTQTITALAIASGYSTSTVLSGTYTINLPPTATPTFSTTNPPGQYLSTRQVTIGDTTTGAVIYYTTDGVTRPTAIASEQYSGAITVSSTETIMAMAVAAGYSNSAVLSGTYTISTAGMSGMVYSGPNPVAGATVKLYSAGNTGYGSAATLLVTASTDTNGNFTLPAAACTAGFQLYVTATDSASQDALLVSALGDCSTTSDKTSIWVNEASTVAAAYALRPFISISGITVNIGAPAANSNSSPSCTGTGSSMTCTANGLAHAFLNALALVNSVSLTGAPAATGTVYTVSPYNSSVSVPTALINSLANAVETCVNPSGDAAAASSCSSLLTEATPPGGTAPTNMLQALMNIAQYPTQNVANIFGLATPVTTYAPALSEVPPDWSLALVYSGITVGTTTTTFGSLHSVALDASDNVYALSSPTASSTLVSGMTSNGEGSFGYTDTTYLLPRILTTDAVGNLFFTNGSTTATDADVVEISNAGVFERAIAIGAPYYAYGVGVDRYNNVYASTEYTVSKKPAVYIIPSGGSTATAATAGGSQVVLGSYPHSLQIDPSGNVWNVADTTGVSSTTLISNTPDGTVAPSFSSAAKVTESTSLSNGYSTTFDSSGNAWINSYTTLFEVPVTAKSQNVTTVTPASVASAPTRSLAISGLNGSGATAMPGAVTFSATDGANAIFMVDYSGEYLWRFIPGTTGGTFVAFQPCAAPNGQTTCNAGVTSPIAAPYRAINTPLAIALDATGAIWIPNSASASITQVLGLAAPAWPQLSYGHPGVAPQ